MTATAKRSLSRHTVGASSMGLSDALKTRTKNTESCLSGSDFEHLSSQVIPISILRQSRLSMPTRAFLRHPMLPVDPLMLL